MTSKTLLAVLLASAPASALAFQGGMNTQGDMNRQARLNTPLLERSDGGVEVSDQAISGQELLNADLTDIGQPLGSVDEIILGEQGEIAFIKYETSRFRDLDGEGTIAVSDLELEATGNFDIDINMSNIESENADRRMRLTEQEQQGRILSNMLRSDISINNNLYDIRDVAFNRSGEAEFLLVSETSGNFLTSEAAFAVPYDSVDYRDGAFRADMTPQQMRTMVLVFQ